MPAKNSNKPLHRMRLRRIGELYVAGPGLMRAVSPLPRREQPHAGASRRGHSQARLRASAQQIHHGGRQSPWSLRTGRFLQIPPRLKTLPYGVRGQTKRDPALDRRGTWRGCTKRQSAVDAALCRRTPHGGTCKMPPAQQAPPARERYSFPARIGGRTSCRAQIRGPPAWCIPWGPRCSARSRAPGR